jgi:hypothetical protein
MQHGRVKRLAAIGISGLVLGVLPLAIAVGPAQADQRTVTTTWRWGGIASNPLCSLQGSVAAYSDGGYVRVRGYFDGCARGRGGSGDRVLTVIGWGPNGKQYGGSTGICWSSCAKTVRVPYTGRGTYYGLIYVTDGGYMRKHGHDPLARPYSFVAG